MTPSGNYLGVDWTKYTGGSTPAQQQEMMERYQGNYNTDPSFQLNLDTPGFEESAPGYTPPNLQMSGPGDVTPDGFDWGTMQGWGQMLGGLGNIGSAYMAYKNYGLAKDQFKFGKQAFNRNLANEAVTTNEALTHKAAIQNTGRAPRVNGTAIG